MPLLTIPYEHECVVDDLTIARASALAPEEFRAAWDWYQSMEGQWIPRLPRGNDSPDGVPIKLAAQRGIHTPSEGSLSGGWRGGRKYAVTIFSSTGRRYADKDVIERSDGTWLFDYRAQKTEPGRETKWDQNRPLLNCLEDGIPVGVLIGQPGGGYRVFGLAYVERYNERTGFFTLHGPVNAMTEGQGIFSSVPGDELSLEDRLRLRDLKRLALDDGDERTRALVYAARRERQQKFRAEVLSAYDGRCAVCGTAIDEVLQAAHIDDFRGRRSQIVQNGILLRADIHLLYDSNLLGIEPDSHTIVLSEAVDMGTYEPLAGTRLRLPRDPRLRPDDEFLDIHYRRFLAQGMVA